MESGYPCQGVSWSKESEVWVAYCRACWYVWMGLGSLDYEKEIGKGRKRKGRRNLMVQWLLRLMLWWLRWWIYLSLTSDNKFWFGFLSFIVAYFFRLLKNIYCFGIMMNSCVVWFVSTYSPRGNMSCLSYCVPYWVTRDVSTMARNKHINLLVLKRGGMIINLNGT